MEPQSQVRPALIDAGYCNVVSYIIISELPFLLVAVYRLLYLDLQQLFSLH